MDKNIMLGILGICPKLLGNKKPSAIIPSEKLNIKKRG